MKKIILIGGGGHCKSCVDVIENEKKYKIVGIVDKKNKNFSLLNYSVFPESYLDKKLVKNNHAFITLGQIKNYKIRVELLNKLRNLGFNKTFLDPYEFGDPTLRYIVFDDNMKYLITALEKELALALKPLIGRY